MAIFVQHVLNGLSTGSIYASMAAGLSLIFGVLGVVNFAHGEFYMVGAYVFLVVYRVTQSMLIGIVSAVVAVSVVGILTERLVVRPAVTVSRMIPSISSWMIPMVATLGLSLFVRTLFLVIFSASPRFVRVPLVTHAVEVLGAYVALQRLLILGLVVACFLALNWFVHKTKIGKAMRAVSQNREVAEILGININRISSVTFAIGASFCGLSGALVGPIIGISPEMGVDPTLKAFAIVILGGFGNVMGAIYAAFIIGLGENLFAAYVSGTFKDVLAFVLMLLILLIKPGGIFGKKVGI